MEENLFGFSNFNKIDRSYDVIGPNLLKYYHKFSNFNKIDRSYDVIGPNLLKYYHKPEKSQYQSEDIITITEEESGFNDLETDQQITCEEGVRFLTKSTQTDFRESDTQTDPWDPPFKVVSIKKELNVLSLKNFTYENGLPASMLEVNYIKEALKNRKLAKTLEENAQGDTFDKMKKFISDQKKSEWNYRVAIEKQLQIKKLDLMRSSLVDELNKTSDKREQILKNIWNRKKKEISLRNYQLEKKLDKEIRNIEHHLLGSRKDSIDQSISKSAENSYQKTSIDEEINGKKADHLLNNYFLSNIGELSTVKDWLEKKQTVLKNRIPIPRLGRKANSAKLTEKAYEDLLFKKRTKLPPKVYHDDYRSENFEMPSMKLEDPVNYFQVEEKKVDMVTVWQQILRGLAYQKQMLNLIEKHKDGISRCFLKEEEHDV